MESLSSQSLEVLKNNSKGFYTVPSENLYPYQWLWDSGFIAIGWAYFNPKRAQLEIKSLLKAQWKNGFLPHIIFHKLSKSYFPGPDFYNASLHKDANLDVPSSTLTQPPIIGFVMQELLKIVEDKKDMLSFIDKYIDQVYLNHHYFYTKRDPLHEGLVYIYHNWESGTDNSPVWDSVFKNIKNVKSYNFTRRDTQNVSQEQRPLKEEYNYYLHIIDIAKKFNYDDEKIFLHSPFLIQDPLFNSLLIKSNQSLIYLYKKLNRGFDKIKILEKWNEKAIQNMNKKLYNKKLQAYVHYDLRSQKQIELLTSSSFAPLFAKIPEKERAENIKKNLFVNYTPNDYYNLPSYDPSDDAFEAQRYWRGPVWINLNWMLYKGLKAYEYRQEAEIIRQDSLEIVKKAGFYEYFDPRKSKYDNTKCTAGYGGKKFSWTAALIIDLINQK